MRLTIRSFIWFTVSESSSAATTSGSERGVGYIYNGISVEFRDADFLDFDTAHNCFRSTFRSEIHEIDPNADLIEAAFLLYILDFGDELFAGIHKP